MSLQKDIDDIIEFGRRVRSLFATVDHVNGGGLRKFYIALISTPGGVMSDPVNHPSHYNKGRIEVIDFAEDQGIDKDAYLFNALKYICRGDSKGNPIEDYKKAVWYLQRKIKRLEHEAAIKTTTHKAEGV